jgi:hypothetical protein
MIPDTRFLSWAITGRQQGKVGTQVAWVENPSLSQLRGSTCLACGFPKEMHGRGKGGVCRNTEAFDCFRIGYV